MNKISKRYAQSPMPANQSIIQSSTRFEWMIECALCGKKRTLNQVTTDEFIVGTTHNVDFNKIREAISKYGLESYEYAFWCETCLLPLTSEHAIKAAVLKYQLKKDSVWQHIIAIG